MSEFQFPGTVPPLWPPTTPRFYGFAADGRVRFEWDERGYRITEDGIVRTRTRHRFPLTEVGWAQAWVEMSSSYPRLAAKVAARAGGYKQQLARLTAYALLPGCTFLGGRQWTDPSFGPETHCTLVFTNDELWAVPPADDAERILLRAPYSTLSALEISGPETVRETEAALLGDATFGLISAALASGSKTLIRLQQDERELFFSCNSVTPSDLRVRLSEPFGKIRRPAARSPVAVVREARPAASPPARPGAASLADALAKLAVLRDSGILTTEEFESLTRRLAE